MGIYNPHAPQVIGQEWVPIKNELYTPDIFREVGYQFTNTVSRALTQGRFYMDTSAEDIIPYLFPSFMMNVYVAGREVATGPIGRVVIPVSHGTLTGTAALSGVSTVQAAVADPEGGGSVATGTSGTIRCNFATVGYGPQLINKRILRVNVIGVALGGPAFVTLEDSNNIQTINSAATAGITDYAEFTISAGEGTVMWSTTFNGNELHAWRWPALNRMSNVGPSPQIQVVFDSTGGGSIRFEYIALEVFFCEETRVASGGSFQTISSTVDPFGKGMNFMYLRDSSYNYPVTLAPGNYTVTLHLADIPL